MAAAGMTTALYIAVVLVRRMVSGGAVVSDCGASAGVMRTFVAESVGVAVPAAAVAASCLRVQILDDEFCHVPRDVRIDEEPHYVEHRREPTGHV